jgi:sugar phosphate isomerase/epimerase
MTNIPKQLGIQSYCFRHFKENALVIEKLKSCGVSKIELCGVHADFTSEDSFAGVLQQYSDGGVEIVSIGVQGFNDNPGNERKYFEFAKRAGAKFMSCSFGIENAPQSFASAEKLSQEYEIKLAIHNHGGYDWLGNSAMLGKMFSMTSDDIGLCLDTAWAMHAGENPLEWVSKFGSRLYGVHIKDFVFDRAGKGEDVVVGTGNLDLPQLLKNLEAVNFNGYAVLEYEGDVENPVPALQKCVAAVQAA